MAIEYRINVYDMVSRECRMSTDFDTKAEAERQFKLHEEIAKMDFNKKLKVCLAYKNSFEDKWDTLKEYRNYVHGSDVETAWEESHRTK